MHLEVIESGREKDQSILFRKVQKVLRRLHTLKYGHTLSATHVLDFPVEPINKTRYGEELGRDNNPLLTLFQNDPISREIDPIEIAWQYHIIYETPNGHLFKKNRLFDDINKGNGLTLIHVTPSLDKIIQSGEIYASGGCLGASIYSVPARPDGRLHNLTKFVIEDQMVNNLHNINPQLMMIKIRPETFNHANMEENWLDYLRFGEFQAHVFQEQVRNGIFSREALEKIKRKVISQIIPAHEFLSLCQEYNLDSISMQEYEKMFSQAINALPLLGYTYFETLSEYIALHQNDEPSQRLAEEGELYTWNYFKTIFNLTPQLYSSFELKKFAPTLEQIAEDIEIRSTQKEGLLNFSKEHFYYYMKWRISQNVRRKILGSKPLPDRDSSFELYHGTNPSLVGHIIHREIRNAQGLSKEHQIYEEARAKKLWNYWNEKDIIVPFNALLPKGEIGINPTFENLSYKVYRAKLLSN